MKGKRIDGEHPSGLTSYVLTQKIEKEGHKYSASWVIRVYDKNFVCRKYSAMGESLARTIAMRVMNKLANQEYEHGYEE